MKTQPFSTILLLTPRDAATALAISQRSLWTRTASGEIPHVRIGRSVRYPVDRLRQYLTQNAERGRLVTTECDLSRCHEVATTFCHVLGVSRHLCELHSTDGGAQDDDGDDAINLTDGIYVLNFLFLGGDAPPESDPFDCGPEPAKSPISFGCDSYPAKCN